MQWSRFDARDAWSGVAEASALVALVVSALFFNGHSSRVFEPDKAALTSSIALLVLGSALAARVDRSSAGPNARGVRSFHPLVLAIAFATVVSCLLSISPRVSWRGSWHRGQGGSAELSYIALALAAAVHARRAGGLERVLATVAVVSLPVGLYALVQSRGLDPLPWAWPTDSPTSAVIGTLGSANHLAAYLVMAIPIALGRAVSTARDALARPEAAAWVRPISYAAISAVGVAALVSTGRRGAFLAFVVSGGAFLLLSLRNAFLVRRPTAATTAVALVLALVVCARALPSAVSFVQGESASATTRVLAWQGASHFLLAQPALPDANGVVDPWHAARWLVGYGPETMAAVLRPFWPRELATVEPGARFDRSHNLLLDTLFSYGLAGSMLQLALFLTACQAAARVMGLDGSFRHLILYCLAGAATVATVLASWLGSSLAVVGLGVGLILGLMTALVRRMREVGGHARVPGGRDVCAASLLAAVIAHWVEAQFGVPVGPAVLLFWVFQVLLVAEAQWPPREGAPAASTALSLGTPILLQVALLVTVCYGFLLNPAAEADSATVLLDGFLPLLPAASGVGGRSAGVLGIVLLVCAIGGLVQGLEEDNLRRARPPHRLALGISLVLAGSWAAILARILAQAASEDELTVAGALAGADWVVTAYGVYLVTVLVLVLSLGAALSAPAWSGRAAGWRRSGAVVLFASCVLAAALNLRVAAADIVWKRAVAADDAGRLDVALPLYEGAVDMDRASDTLRASAGWAVLRSAQQESGPSREVLLDRATLHLRHAALLSPHDADRWIDLARIARYRAAIAAHPGTAAGWRAEASRAYVSAARLSPGDARLVAEWESWH